MCALRRLPLRSSHHPRKACITSPTATSLAIAVFIVNTDQTTAEGEYFAKGNENRVMYLAQWWADEARHQHRASKDAQCHSGDELELFHRIWKLDRFTEGPFTLFTERPLVTLAE